MKILVTGFQPFNKEKLNPSELLLPALANAGFAVKLLPVEYEGAFRELQQTVLSEEFDGVVLLGQASGRSSICLEKVALNWEDCDVPDEGGDLRREQFIRKTAPVAYLNPLPISKWQTRLKAKGFAVEVSLSAGSFVCNSTYYRALDEIQKNPQFPRWALFVHVPFLPEQAQGKPVGTPSMTLENMTETVLELLRLISGEKNLTS